ncbi:uncharacterized protein N7515_001298 [Penicillium bovifimosum]|uniref:CCHC-type domain-containing protein n=1 Tax=Penicillium bovifimosum TaxID=126998 RepID=A0A9W9H9E7_9EURO|nr:uncharacterized protein N7515_001298 [Penicillium bovifimosum]KAJ5142511.1 hypothetical protein N7515_001298 [Penicillium bovifimosum]
MNDNDNDNERAPPSQEPVTAPDHDDENRDHDDEDEVHEEPSNELERRIGELAKEVLTLRKDNEALRRELAEAVSDQEEAIAHRDIARRQRDELAYQLLSMQRTGHGTPNMGSLTQKSTKMPDAPILNLNDGKEVRFETWETVIRQKPEANSDHHPLPVHRLLYVQSRCEGKAQLHIAPRMHAGASNPYLDAEDMISHLRSVFQNRNRESEALAQYQKLSMKPKDSFTDFLAEFMQLAEEAGVMEKARKRDLKLPYLLQTQENFEPHSTTGSGSGASQQTAGPKVKTERSPALTPSEHEALLKAGKCFFCKEHGHVSKECPKKKQPAINVSAAQVPASTRIEELEETDQGKASA